MSTVFSPPHSIDELVERVASISGQSFAQIARDLQVEVPENFKAKKGWTGQLLEQRLGATGGARPQHDFPQLGIELKTIPINANGVPLETTYVCYAPLIISPGTQWPHSNVYHKLRQVLWVLVEGHASIPIHQRRVGRAILWCPSEEEDNVLARDWYELTDLIAMGNVERITATLGEVLHLRPKAANGRALTSAYGPDGNKIVTRPRGFYLRTQFTHAIIQRAFALGQLI